MVLNKYVSLAPLPRQGTGVVEGLVCQVSGWGHNNVGGGQTPFTLRTVAVPIVSAARCNSSESFNGNITANMICAGYRTGGRDACKVQADTRFSTLIHLRQTVTLNRCEVSTCRTLKVVQSAPL